MNRIKLAVVIAVVCALTGLSAGKAQAQEGRSNVKKVTALSNLLFQYSADGSSWTNIDNTNYASLFGSSGWYRVGFLGLPLNIRLEEAKFGLSAGTTTSITKIGGIYMFSNVAATDFSDTSPTLHDNEMIFDWNGSQITPSNGYGDWVQAREGKDAPYYLAGYQASDKAMFRNDNDYFAPDPKPKYGEFMFTNISVPTSPNQYYLAMDVTVANGETGKIYFELGDGSTVVRVPEPAYYQLTALLMLGGLGILRYRRNREQFK